MNNLKPSERVPTFYPGQETFISPCLRLELGKPVLTDEACGICRAHARNKKMRTPCQLTQWLSAPLSHTAQEAYELVEAGMAKLVNWDCLRGFTAIQLTSSRFINLRDRSLKIDEHFLAAYADEERWALAIFADAERAREDKYELSHAAQ